MNWDRFKWFMGTGYGISLAILICVAFIFGGTAFLVETSRNHSMILKEREVQLYAKYPEAYEYYESIHSSSDDSTNENNQIIVEKATNTNSNNKNSTKTYIQDKDGFVGSLEYVGEIKYNDLNTFELYRDPEYGGEYYMTTKGQLVPRLGSV